MKLAITLAAAGMALAGSLAPALAQPYGGYGGGGYSDRDRGYDDRRGGYRDDRGGDGYSGRGDYDRAGRGGGGFDSEEYMRCNPDVRRAVRTGQLSSAADHYRVFGRREGRRLSCR
jgi:hypothetical protein